MRVPLVVVLLVLAWPIAAVALLAGRAAGGLARRLLVGIGIIVACLPTAVILTLALLPLWRWLEAARGIESVGHSGPAEWCYLATYLACAMTSSGLYILRVRSRAQGRTSRAS